MEGRKSTLSEKVDANWEKLISRDKELVKQGFIPNSKQYWEIIKPLINQVTNIIKAELHEIKRNQSENNKPEKLSRKNKLKSRLNLLANKLGKKNQNSKNIRQTKILRPTKKEVEMQSQIASLSNQLGQIDKKLKKGNNQKEISRKDKIQSKLNVLNDELRDYQSELDSNPKYLKKIEMLENTSIPYLGSKQDFVQTGFVKVIYTPVGGKQSGRKTK